MPFTAGFLDQKLHEVQRRSHFKIQISGFSEEFSFHIRSGNLPTRSFDVISTRYFNEMNKQAGNATFNDLGIAIHDAIGFDIEKKIQDWQEEIQRSVDGKMGYAEDYKRTAVITEYGVNGEKRSGWILTGVFPQSVNYGDLDRESVDKKTINMNLSYDKGWIE